MLEAFMAKFGKGAAELEIALPKSTYHIGETVEGEVLIRGGKVRQEIEKVEVHFVKGQNELGIERSHTLGTITVSQSFSIEPKEEKTMSFQLRIPTETELPNTNTAYYITSKLHIDGAFNDYDKEYIHVKKNNCKNLI
ncbi:sporulation protein [Ectobacillus panaciterrae]|uniref:sporulation protein n=1 Tax=Ectobacillus panaciterrae TaxID=363872 RepID=UPI000416F2EF|nr:sporulation protein [Ectobacillus panaciterrae]